MAKPTSVQASSSPPGGGGALVFLSTVLISLAFFAFVLIMGYPLEYGIIAVVASCVVAAVMLRLLYTGDPVSKQLPGHSTISRFLIGGLRAALQKDQQPASDDHPAASDDTDPLAEQEVA